MRGTMSRIDKDYKRCETVIKDNSKTFYKAFSRIKDRHRRNGVYAVYAFCRMVDDAIDVEKDLNLLERYEHELIAFSKGDVPDHFMWRALRDTKERFYPNDYDFQPFFEMIEGQRMDIDHKGYQSVETLLDYCYHVASTVGLMLLPILAPENHRHLRDFAVELGYAMQLTNILRDIGEDAKDGRVYLPQNMLAQANLTSEDLVHGKITDEFIGLFEALAGIAEDFYDQALARIDAFDYDVRLPLGLSIILYRAIIDACRASGYNVFTKKNHVSDDTKNKLIETYRKSLASKGEKR